MTFLDWFVAIAAALLGVAGLAAAGRKRTRGQGRVDVALILAAALLIALVVILFLITRGPGE